MENEHISIKSEMEKIKDFSNSGFDSWIETAGKSEMQRTLSQYEEEEKDYWDKGYHTAHGDDFRDNASMHLVEKHDERIRRIAKLKERLQGEEAQ